MIRRKMAKRVETTRAREVALEEVEEAEVEPEVRGKTATNQKANKNSSNNSHLKRRRRLRKSLINSRR